MASGELLNMLQKNARNGTLLSSCEPEVKELMHQLDILISDHQREWEGKMRETQAELKLREKELATLRISLQERTDQLERVRLRGVELDQEHRARHADCEAQLVRVRSELSRLRHSYEQLRAKRSSQQKSVTAGSGGHGTTNYRQECHCLRSQLAGAKVKEREMERECRELRERLKKREEEMERVEVERRQSQLSVSHLQETIRSKDGLIRDLEEKVGVANLSASYQSELEQMKGKVTTLRKELGAHLEVEKGLRDELHRTRREGDNWKQQLDKVKVQQGQEESEVVRRLEERVQKLEHQLKESHRSSGRGETPQSTKNEAIGRFEAEAERVVHSPVGGASGRVVDSPVGGAGGGCGYVALEPVHPHHHPAAPSGEGEGGEREQWSQLLEGVLGKHFDQLDSSLQRMLSPN